MKRSISALTCALAILILTCAAGVIVPKTGTLVKIINVNTQGNFMQVQVRPVN